ncbi:MAG: SEC-C metal-binding domain-containing protein [Chloroflexota bacterium]
MIRKQSGGLKGSGSGKKYKRCHGRMG